ncbi:TonB-dependent receptor domain-containing protein [Sphingomonas paeninsulae]|uniref:TonB-dependent receptor domain-containing protein n=1 Tax=Sphingomonas paeninsulae TaxID=2319844 RepID=UPI0024112E91|nr:TonB-dependent receptor [Sphingomonas paeninsulae]
MISFFRGRLLASSLFVGAVAVTGPAFSQAANSPLRSANTEAEDADGLIIVTGSRIPRAAYDNNQPTITTSGALLDERAITTVAQALNQTPGFGIADSSLVGNQGNGFGVGQSFVNLYSLGSQRTLTLVNGRRFVGANPASVFSFAGSGTQVDLNVIPTKLIERVETIGIGGAPIYGADAIAGTVNIILKKKFNGLDLDAQSGISNQADLFNWRVRGLAGTDFAGGRGNFTAVAEYVSSDGLLGNERASIRAQNGFIAPLDPNSHFSQVLAGNLRTFLGTPGGNPYIFNGAPLGPGSSIVDANGGFVRFGPNGNLVPFNTGTPTADPTTFLGGDNLNAADITNLAVNSERINTAAFINYDLTDSVHAFAEGWYSKNRATNLAGQPVYNTGFAQSDPGSFNVNGNFVFKLSNPYLTAQARDIIRANLVANGLPSGDDADFYVGRANTDLVSGVAKLNQDLYRFVGGFNGDLTLFGNKWSWEASGNYGRTRSESITPTLVEPNLRRALNVTTNAAGQIVCAPFAPDPNDPTAPPNTPEYSGTISTTCTPLNLFGNGAPSQAARDYITTNARTVAITSQRDFLATITGAIVSLPGGDLAASLGYENRREYSSFQPDTFYTAALGRSAAIVPLAGSYTTNEVFGEVRVPLISPAMEVSFIHALEANAAGRWVDNSVAGKAFTWTAGGRFAPTRDLAIRGNFTRSIRAPAATELFAANQPAFDGGFDPCDRRSLSSGPNPATRQANCAAAGLPTNFVSLITRAAVPINVIGNRNLQNEVANSWTIGAVLQPRFVPNLSLSIDYISINLRQTIVASSARDVLSGCYDANDYPNNVYCSLITRSNAASNFGQVLTLDEPYINQGGRVFRSIQAVLDYRVALPRSIGMLTLGRIIST